MAWSNGPLVLYHGRDDGSASTIINSGISLDRCRVIADFGQGVDKPRVWYRLRTELIGVAKQCRWRPVRRPSRRSYVSRLIATSLPFWSSWPSLRKTPTMISGILSGAAGEALLRHNIAATEIGATMWYSARSLCGHKRWLSRTATKLAFIRPGYKCLPTARIETQQTQRHRLFPR